MDIHGSGLLFFINNTNTKCLMTVIFWDKLLTPLPNLWPTQHIYALIIAFTRVNFGYLKPKPCTGEHNFELREKNVVATSLN